MTEDEQAPAGQLADAPEPVAGWRADELRDELPDLRLLWLSLDARPGRSPRALKHRLRELSSRFRGAHAVAMRQAPIPWAYRVFYRHIGLDPDATRIPVEEAAVQRLLHGGFRSRNVLDDALTVAVIETGVPVWALDAGCLDGGLGLRTSAAGEALGRAAEAPSLAPGRIVVADERSPVAVLFGELAPGHGVSPETTRIALYTVQVTGVPEIHAEEALWSCAGMLRDR